METINFDTGIRSYRVGGGILRFNPTDPNLYARFLDALEELAALEQTLPQGTGAISALRQVDQKAKAILQRVFGEENDISAVFGGVNLMAVGENGHRILENFVSALEPILTEGAVRWAKEKAETAQ